MAAQKSNPNLTQSQYNVLSARVNELTGYQTKYALFNSRKPKETVEVIAARKVVAKYDDACEAVRQSIDRQIADAKAVAQEALLFQTAEKALAAVKKLEFLK